MPKMKNYWKQIPGYSNYSVSNYGAVKSKPRSGSKGGLLRFRITKCGYVEYSLSTQVNGKQKAKKFKAHQLVLLAFKRGKSGHEQINHKDGNKKNNRLENLEYCTRYENIRHRIEVLGIDISGDKHGRSKLTKREAQFLIWLKAKYGDSITANSIAKFYGLAPITIQYLWKGKSWKCLQNITKTFFCGVPCYRKHIAPVLLDENKLLEVKG